MIVSEFHMQTYNVDQNLITDQATTTATTSQNATYVYNEHYP